MDVLDRREGVGGELVLRAVGEHYEVIENGVFLMDTRNGESERLLVSAAAAAMPVGGRMLVGGLGVGFSLRAAVDDARVGAVVVVEREAAVIEWNRGPLRGVHGDALAEESVTVVEADLVSWLSTTPERFDAICLDVDNGPEWTVTEGNAALYGDSGLRMLRSRLDERGVLAVWSANASTAFESRLRGAFASVDVLTVPVPRGEPDVVYLATSL